MMTSSHMRVLASLTRSPVAIWSRVRSIQQRLTATRSASVYLPRLGGITPSAGLRVSRWVSTRSYSAAVSARPPSGRVVFLTVPRSIRAPARGLNSMTSSLMSSSKKYLLATPLACLPLSAPCSAAMPLSSSSMVRLRATEAMEYPLNASVR